MDRISRLEAHLRPVEQSQAQGVLRQATAMSSPSKAKVAVLGAGGGIGQPLAMLMKMNPLVAELSLYDVVGTPGVAADLAHIDTAAKVTCATGPEELSKALYGCNLVIIPAGVPRKPGMTRDDLFNINAGIVQGLCEGIAKYCPKAWVAIISNPVNSTVPIAAEVFKKAGMYDPRKLMGVTKLDVCRAQAFWAELADTIPSKVDVPVVGGHAGVTILPLLSQATPKVDLSKDKAKALMERIQNAGTEVVNAKAGKGSATLSMAYAAAEFGNSCLRAMAGEANITECAYVDSHVTDLPYFATKLTLGADGVKDVGNLGRLNELETEGLEGLKAELRGSIQKGIDFVASGKAGQ
ncbi:hypothetical protein WJX84_011521 [Apatococcus fuscideae]|uniref:malate dehydrogenase n=1 Tax=Apatococcus fuscideae TaxID=2026836 RepID=A0AAW1TIS6_9CHLO